MPCADQPRLPGRHGHNTAASARDEDRTFCERQRRKEIHGGLQDPRLSERARPVSLPAKDRSWGLVASMLVQTLQSRTYPRSLRALFHP
jgi:hypothetical protein